MDKYQWDGLFVITVCVCLCMQEGYAVTYIQYDTALGVCGGCYTVFNAKREL